MCQTRVLLLFQIDLLVKWTWFTVSSYQKNNTWTIRPWRERLLRTHVRTVQLHSTRCLQYYRRTQRWLRRKSLILKNVNHMKVWTTFTHKFTAHLLHCTKKKEAKNKTVIFTLFLWFSVNYRTLPLAFHTTAHVTMNSSFSTLKKSFFF